MNYEEFAKYLKQEKLDKNVLLFYGEEAFLKSHCKEELLKRIMPDVMPEFNVISFDGRKYDLKAVEEAIEALPVMAETKVILFRNSMIFTINGRDAATKDYKEFWEKRLTDIPEDVYIIFDEDKIDKRSALYKKLVKQDAFAEFSYLTPNKMINWTVALFKTMGKVISPHEAKYLLEISNEGMLFIKREAEKIAAYTQDKIDVLRADIDAVVVPVLENKVFDMVDAILAKNTTVALLLLQDLVFMKEDEIKILGAITSNLTALLTIKQMSSVGMDRAQIAAKSQIAPFKLNKYLPLSAKYELESLENLLTMCVESDRKFKLSPADKTVLLQRLIIDFAEKKTIS